MLLIRCNKCFKLQCENYYSLNGKGLMLKSCNPCRDYLKSHRELTKYKIYNCCEDNNKLK